MTARSVTGTVLFPGTAQPCVGARVTAALYAAGEPAFGVGSDQLTVGEVGTLTDNNGEWSLTLEPNELITPSGTVWQITIRPPDRAATTVYVDVPDSAGPHEIDDIASDAPGSLPSNATTLAIAARALRVDVRDHGLAASNTAAANTAAWAQMVAALDVSHPSPVRPTVVFPLGEFQFAETIRLERPLDIAGQGGANNRYTADGEHGTKLSWPADTTGIYVLSSGSRISDVALDGGETGTPPAAGDTCGIEAFSKVDIDGVFVAHFAGDGIRVTGGAGLGPVDNPNPNANHWRLDNCIVRKCGGHGVSIIGSDANTGVGTHVDGSECRGAGISDACVWGNTWIGCHSATNLGAAYAGQTSSGFSTWLGCYSEADQPAAYFSKYDIVIGGSQGAGVEPRPDDSYQYAYTMFADEECMFVRTWKWRSQDPDGDGSIVFSHTMPDQPRLRIYSPAGVSYGGLELYADDAEQAGVLAGPNGAVVALPTGKRFEVADSSGPTTFASFDVSRSQLTMTGPVRAGQYTTAARPAASTAGAGAMVYDTTLSKPIWSNGSVWKDAAGTTV